MMMTLEAVVAPGVGTRTQQKFKAPNVNPLQLRQGIYFVVCGGQGLFLVPYDYLETVREKVTYTYVGKMFNQGLSDTEEDAFVPSHTLYFRNSSDKDEGASVRKYPIRILFYVYVIYTVFLELALLTSSGQRFSWFRFTSSSKILTSFLIQWLVYCLVDLVVVFWIPLLRSNVEGNIVAYFTIQHLSEISRGY